MPDCRLAWSAGGTWFFTVNLLERHDNHLLVQHVNVLREVVSGVRARHPFRIHGWVVLPEHLHCVIELPPGDMDFAKRWRLIKSDFSKALPITERRSAVRQKRGERAILQRRYWEHLIRDERDYAAHMDYVHIKPGEAWAGAAGDRLGAFDFPSSGGAGCLCGGLGGWCGRFARLC